MATIAELFARALQQHQAGKLAQAEELYRQVLASDPRHAPAWHFLGVLAHQAGQHEQAIAWMRRSIELDAADPACQCNLGAACAAAGRLEEAAASYRAALRLQPDLAPAHNNLANALKDLNQPEQALAHYRQALRLRPDYAEAHNNLGTIQKDQGQLALALASFRQAVRLLPNYVSAHVNLAAALTGQEKLEEAAACCRQALRLAPDSAEAHYNLGNIFLKQSQLPQAQACYLQALRLKPDFAQAHSDLGSALKAQGRLAEAQVSYARALQIKPDLVEAHANLGNALLDQGQLKEAMACYHKALAIKPGFALAHTNLLFSLNHDPEATPEAIFAEHCRWGELHGHPPFERGGYRGGPHVNEPDPERRLRIGYVSPDFRKHPVARFFEPILAHHDPAQFEAVCFAELRAPDEVTARLRALARGWHSTCGLTDAEAADLVRGNGIDILVDLAGHTANHRLQVFAHKPAPVGVSYLGYPNTTGLTSIDYRLSDAALDPPAEPQRYTEELVRLPLGVCCFAPPQDAPPVAPLPSLGAGRITFGSPHRLEKLNPVVFDLWCRVLHALPSARMLVFWPTLTGAVEEAVRRQFTDRGISALRLELRHQLPARLAATGGSAGRAQIENASHLAIYDDIDIVLDVFPWTGHATTCEALWMGVPVLTLTGDRVASRLSATVLTRLDLTELIADTPEKFVRLALGWAADREKLARLRGGLRQRMQATICDGHAFTRSLEAAYRTMWRKWCAGQGRQRS